MIRVFFFLLGFGFMVIGSSFIILYLNLTTMGYNFFNYVNFISRRFECYFSIIGFIIMSSGNIYAYTSSNFFIVSNVTTSLLYFNKS